ncbi:tryptophan 2,3-dioxygenase family protein [Nocardia sp. NBC_00881]|uniref:tryptophan 2,3-dioxygenase family protein n=1 Tax=Nocardia sp. NBC_00881 TaxID=2975995 RepID=UPI00386FC875|nr:tryptophan 2,3-dioxygenase family protein [Nocardia sp. NBC_00881]
MDTDLAQLTYADYLHLDQVLGAQQPRTDPEQHDEMMFIICHQVTELWLKLLLHELTAVREAFRADTPGLPTLSRAEQVLLRLNEQWAVLDTLSPGAFHLLRPYLGRASGLYSKQYRDLEFLLGKRHPGWRNFAARYATEPSLFDELIRYLHRRGHAVPEHYLERDWSRRRESTPELFGVFQRIQAAEQRVEYQIATHLLAIDGHLREWRRRHLQLVLKHLGSTPGTAGTSGARYLEATIDDVFFPELIQPQHD